MSNKDCQPVYDIHKRNITERMLCAGSLLDGGNDTCQVRKIKIIWFVNLDCAHPRFCTLVLYIKVNIGFKICSVTLYQENS